MLRKIFRWVEGSFDEIAESRELSFYGVGLAFIHVLTYVFWFPSFADIMSSDRSAICWPFFESCHNFRGLPESALNVLFVLYLIVAVVCAAMFLRKETIKKACALLAFLTFIKFFILIQDYAFMGNYHYMPFLVTVTFLFLPAKKDTIRWLIVLFYLSAGSLKLNYEWLSGASVGAPLPFVSTWVFEILCAYVVVLELVFVWGLLSKYKMIRWVALGQFVLFHLVSWYWVGYFYPLTMMPLLFIFPLHWRSESSSLGFSGVPVRSRVASVLFIGIVALMQIPPWIVNSDPALNGHLRLTSLNMFDARSVCVFTSTLRYTTHSEEYVPDSRRFGVRIHCDPIVFISELKRICRTNRSMKEFVDIDVFLRSRRSTDAQFTDVLRVRDFCRNEEKYSFWSRLRGGVF